LTSSARADAPAMQATSATLKDIAINFLMGSPWFWLGQSLP
jgi:hypothetical protein